MKNILYSAAKSLLDFGVGALARLLPALKPTRQLASFAALPAYQPTLPVNIASITGPLLQGFQQPVLFREYHLDEFHDVFVSWDGAIFRDFRLSPASIVHTRFLRRFQDTFLLRQWLGSQVVLPAATSYILVAHDQWSTSNYYHWLVDTLPRLLRAREAGLDILLLLPQPLPPKQIADYIIMSAQALGFTKFFPLNTKQILHASQVALSELTAESLYQDPTLIRQVQQEVLLKFGLSHPAPTRRVYASRSTQTVRRLTNESEIGDLLSSHGFETVYFEELSFIGQMQLMQETAIFIGIHGANMTNLLFLPSTAIVVELLNIEHGDLCYFRLASSVGLPYYCVPCTATQVELYNQSDLIVDVSFMTRMLAELIEPAAR